MPMQELELDAERQAVDNCEKQLLDRHEPSECDSDDSGLEFKSHAALPLDGWSHVGYLAQYFTVGLVLGGLPATLYGVFIGYLNVPAHVYSAAHVVMTLPWSFKWFFGLLNDCVPIRGYRRKPYMVIGWACCSLTLFLLSRFSLPPPYWCRDSNGVYVTQHTTADGTQTAATPCNAAAAEAGGPYALLMCLAALGYVVADVAADGLTVQYARREAVELRGRMQTAAYMTRTIGSACAVSLVGFGMNGHEYNGSFEHGLSFNAICGLLALPTAAMVPVSWYLVDEPKTTAAGSPRSLVAYMRTTTALLSSRAMFHIVLYQFFTPLIGNISTTAGGLVKRYWAGVQNLQNQIFSLIGTAHLGVAIRAICGDLQHTRWPPLRAVCDCRSHPSGPRRDVRRRAFGCRCPAGNALFAVGLALVRGHFLNASWRLMLLSTTVLLNVIDMPFVFCTIFDVIRNQYFYLGETVLVEIPAAANFVVATFVVVEMADDCNEGLVYGLLTTMHNLGSPVARAIGNQFFSLFTPSLSDSKNYIDDTPAFRSTVAKSFCFSYFFAFVSLVTLLLLPDQKAEAQRRKLTWPLRSRYATITIALAGCGMCYGVAVNLLSMFKSTMCLKFAGGHGCT